ncbi:MAG: ABC transporter permease [Chloroflexi bacterium]|nr:ABC transporter permease [Chloroflexota bacterium]
MTRHLARRLASTFVTLVVVSLVTFWALDATPGDAASALVGENASRAQLQAVRAELGLDQSLFTRYATFATQVFTRGDLGRSLVSRRAVGALVLERLPYTLILAFTATFLAIILGMTMGTLAAMRGGSWLDTGLMSGAAFMLAVPTFWSALMLMLLFSLKLRWLPVVGAETPWHLVLPATTLALPTGAVIARLVRVSLLDVLGADFVRTAHAKGIAPRDVLTRHTLRNSLIPVVTVVGLHLGHLLGGAFIVETIFALPGLGRLTVQAIFDRDAPVVLGATLTVAAIYLAINLLVDLAQGWLDPQVAHAAV